MENNFKRFLSLLLAFVMVFGLMPANVFAISDDICDNCGRSGLYVTGWCPGCNTGCDHSAGYMEGICNVCSQPCVHEWDANYCKVCNMYCYDCMSNHNTEGKCNNCGNAVGHTFEWHNDGSKNCQICGALNPNYEEPVTEVYSSDELQNALNAGGKIRLGNGFYISKNLKVPAGVDVELDMNGYYLSRYGSNEIRISVLGNLTIIGSGSITVKDITVESTGALNADGIKFNGERSTFSVFGTANISNCTLTGTFPLSCSGGVLNIKDTSSSGSSTGLVQSRNGGVVTVDGGTFNGLGYNVLYTHSGGTITVLDGIFQGGLENYEANPGSITIYGGTFTADVSAYLAAGLMQDETGKVVEAKKNYVAKVGETGYETLMEAIGNAVDGQTVLLLADQELAELTLVKGICLDTNGFAITGSIVLATETATVKGGEGLSVTTGIADHKVVYADGTYMVVVVEKNYVAKIGETGYETLAAAIAAVKNGDVIKLLADITESVTITQKKNVAFTIDGAKEPGVSAQNASVDQDANYTCYATINFNGTGNASNYNQGLTIRNVNFVVSGPAIYSGGKTYPRNLTVENCSFTGFGGNSDYALYMRYSYNIVAKNCVADNLTYFMFSGTSFTGFTAEDVTIRNTKYGIRMGYVNTTALLKNVVIENTEVGVELLNNAAGTVTFENCSIEADTNLKLLQSATVTKVLTVKFVGDNEMICTGESWLVNDTPGNFNVNLDVDGDGNDNVTVEVPVPSVAAIGEEKYASLGEAIAAASAGNTITLLADITEDVTVQKDLTIDGAGKNYTGNISVKGSAVDIVVKNVNFVNGSGYAITTNTIKSVTVENCTVTNYGYGFLYANKSTTTVKVKDVTVENCNYGFHWVYGSSATLENVTMTNVTNGLYIQNYAAKTVTLKGCTITNISIWERSGYSGVQTFKFEGANAVGTLSTSQYAKYVLTATDATLTAPAGANVTTNVEGFKVIHDGVAYILVDENAVAAVNGMVFTSLQAAMDACVAGDNTVELMADLGENVTIKQVEGVNITIDGDNHIYSGTVTIHGNARYEGAETLTFQNIKFETSESGHYFIDSNSTGSVERYAHNVTVKDSSFTATGEAVDSAVAMRIRQGYNISVENVTATGLHSVMQGYGVAGISVKDLTATDMKNGISAGTSTNVVIENANIEAEGYGIRADGNGAYGMTVLNAEITAQDPIVVRKASGAYTLTVSGSALTGTNAKGYGIILTQGDDGSYEFPTGDFDLNVTNTTGKIFPSLDGEGTEASPFLISNLAELIFFRDSVNAGETTYNADGVYVALTADIDLAGTDWSVNIGDDCNATFDGIFDGQNHKILNLTATENAAKADGYFCTGLFGAIYGNAVVKNLTIENVSINTGAYVGNNVAAVVGFAYSAKGSIENVTVTGDIQINANEISGVGAIVGYVYGGTLEIKGCSAIGNEGSAITGLAYVGGIVGYGDDKMVISGSSVENVAINAASCIAGGIAGLLEAGGKIDGGSVKDVTLTSAHDNWQNAVGIAVGSVNGTVTVSNVTAENVSTTAMVGAVFANHPTAPVAKVAAKIGDTYYTTFAAAYDAAQAGETIDLLAEQTETLTIEKAICVNTNGNTVSGIVLADLGATVIGVVGLNVTTEIADYKVVRDGDVYKVVPKDYVAEVNGVSYEKLSEAITAAASGSTITFLADIAEDVTVQKDLTIDGAGKNYTGNISVKGSAVDIVVKNVNFVNGSGYAITTNTIKSVTVENCTVTNYGYGFLYANKSTTTVKVKDVTVENCNYGFHWVYGSSATLENVTMTNVTNGLYIQNYAAKTVTLKGCTITNISIWERSGYSGVQTFKFEGENAVASLSESQYAKYVLTATDATLTAPEGATVTTPVEGYEVEHANGVYTVVEIVRVAQIGQTQYKTLAAAIAAAQAGDTITFLDDITEDVTVTTKVTIDGAGKTFTGKMTLKADTTILNVNFDGKGYNGYAVETRGANYLTIDGCTAKNYGYGFVQLASGTALTTVKNVTVTNMNYGVKVDYSGAVVLENVNMTVGVAAVLNSNYGEKTITIKDSFLNILGTWKRNDTVKTTYIFEGANTVGEFKTESALDTFKLATESSTLTAADGQTVITDIPDYKVVYENGMYKVVAKHYVAAVNGVSYEKLSEAITAAASGSTITFLADITEDVTVQKDLTIDGAGKNYTGNISVKGSAVDIVVKNVNFVNGSGYAITTNTIKSITVEDCTVTNYGYGFLYANKSTTTVKVKNVTVDGGNYGFHWVYGSNATLENVTMTNVTNGLYIQNYASKTIILKGCDITSISIWERSGYSGVQTFKFEGVNTVGTLTDSTYAKYVLAATDATLTAPEAVAVESGIEGYKVVYENGAHKLAEIHNVAEVNGVKFESIQEAVEAAQDGETVIIIADHEIACDVNPLISISGKSVIIDLNGKTITANASSEDAEAIVRIVFKTEADGNLTVQDSVGSGSVIANGEGVLYYMFRNEGGMTVKSGSFELSAFEGGAMFFSANSNMLVEGGNFKQTTSGWMFNTAGNGEGNVITVSGGTFNRYFIGGAEYNENPYGEVDLADGYICVDNGDGTWNVREGKWIAEIAETGKTYESLAEAVAAVQNGETIVLLADTDENVTISKNLTIDGAGKNYTGILTLNNVTVTIENVNFVAGQIYKNKSTGTSAKVTIKDCSFDGQGLDAYAVNIGGTNGIVIENVTAKGYGYGFLQVPASATSVSLKNVEISDVNYGIKIDYSSAVALENVVITDAAVAGILDSNYGAKTYSITNCEISGTTAIAVWVRNTEKVDTFVFFGDNKISDSANAEQAIYKMGDLNATVTAPEGLNIVVDDPNYTVIHEEGVYKVAAIVAKNVSTNTIYLDLSDALKDANSGETVELMCDTYEELVLVPAGVKFDLHGFIVEADNVLSFGVVMDSDTEVGGIKISNDTTQAFTKLQPENGGYLPIYDNANHMYKFFEYKLFTVSFRENGGATQIGVKLQFKNFAAYELLRNEENAASIKIGLTLYWENLGTGYEVRYPFKTEKVAELAQKIVTNNKETYALTCTVTGLDAGQYLNVSGWVENDAGVNLELPMQTYTKP